MWDLETIIRMNQEAARKAIPETPETLRKPVANKKFTTVTIRGRYMRPRRICIDDTIDVFDFEQTKDVINIKVPQLQPGKHKLQLINDDGQYSVQEFEV